MHNISWIWFRFKVFHKSIILWNLVVHIWNLWISYKPEASIPRSHRRRACHTFLLQLEFSLEWGERETPKSLTTPPTPTPRQTLGSALRMTWLLLTSPTGFAPSSFPSLSGVLPAQAAQACFQFLEYSRLTSSKGPLPKSSHCLECSPSAGPATTAQFPPTQLNHTSVGWPGDSNRSALLMTHSRSSTDFS